MIHPTAVVHPSSIVESGAVLDERVMVGPFCYIGKNVRVGAGTTLHSHIVINGLTTIGCDNQIFQFASIGECNQDLKYQGEATQVVIGNNNRIREHVTIHRGTRQGGQVTTVGHNNLLMVNTHIAHDCIIGNYCVLANNATLGGHVEIDDYAIIGGMSAVHQFCIIGRHVMVGGCSGVSQDVPPYIIAQGNHASPYGLNNKGLKQYGFSTTEVQAIERAYRIFYRSNQLLKDIKMEIKQLAKQHPVLQPFIDFLKRSKRGFVR